MAETTEDLENMIRIDEGIDDLLEIFNDLLEDIEKIEPKNVPQQASKDKMKEILERAFMPYLSELIQCNQVFEQGTE